MTTPHETIRCMITYGGEFMKSLARTWQIADSANRTRLESTFAFEFGRYSEMAETIKKRNENETNENETTP